MLLTQENAKEVLLDASMKKTVFLYFYQNVDQCAKATQAVTSQIADNNEYISLVQADIETPIAQSIAMQIGVQTIPTLIIWQQGRPTDMLQGDEIVTKLVDTIAKYMPSEAQLLLREALTLEANDQIDAALAKAKQAYDTDKSSQVKFIYTRLLIKQKNTQAAEEILKTCGREEQSSADYQDLMSALDLAKKAQESPEIVELKQALEADPNNDEIATKLAAALSSVGKKQEALEILFARLQKDLSKADIKKTFLDILSTMSGDKLQNQYRRKLYTLMY